MLLHHRLPLIPVRKAIEAIPADAWTPSKYTNAIYDEASQSWISNAEVAKISYTAFASKAKWQRVTARLIVRRVPDLNPNNQSELFTACRYHAVFTISPLPMLEVEKNHRAHAVVEQVITDLKNGPLAHLPSGHSWANSCLAGLRRDGVQPRPRRRRPRPSTPARRPAPSARNSSPSPTGSPAPHGTGRLRQPSLM